MCGLTEMDRRWTDRQIKPERQTDKGQVRTGRVKHWTVLYIPELPSVLFLLQVFLGGIMSPATCSKLPLFWRRFIQKAVCIPFFMFLAALAQTHTHSASVLELGQAKKQAADECVCEVAHAVFVVACFLLHDLQESHYILLHICPCKDLSISTCVSGCLWMLMT